MTEGWIIGSIYCTPRTMTSSTLVVLLTVWIQIIFRFIAVTGRYATGPIDITEDFCENSKYWNFDVVAGTPVTANWDGSSLPDGCRIQFEPDYTLMFHRYTVCMKITSYLKDCNLIIRVGIDDTSTYDDESDDYDVRKVYQCYSNPPEICTEDTYEAIVLRIDRVVTYRNDGQLSVKVSAYHHGEDEQPLSSSVWLAIGLSLGALALFIIACICKCFIQRWRKKRERESYTQGQHHVPGQYSINQPTALQRGIQYVNQSSNFPPQNVSQSRNRADNIAMENLHNKQRERQPQYDDEPPPYSSVKDIR